MNKNGSSTDLVAKHEYLLNLSAMFEKYFCIDWIIDLTGMKPSDILTAFEQLVEARYLHRKQPGIYYLSKATSNKQLKQLSSEEQITCHQRIIRSLINEKGGNYDKAILLHFHLLKISNDIEGCRWLKIAGDEFLKQHKTEQSLKCYLKIIEDLSAYDFTEEAATLFIETALQYGKISMARQETSKVLSILNNALQLAQEYKYYRWDSASPLSQLLGAAGNDESGGNL